MSASNIILITMDECRRDALSCYGGMGVATPHMDRLAAEGVRFPNALTPSPVCGPARCALLSGCYPHRTGKISNTTGALLPPERPNLFNQLRAAGMRTAMVGKCHFTGTPYDRLTYGKPLPGEAIRDYLLSLGMDHLDLCDGKVAPFWFWDDYSLGLREAGLFDTVAYPGTPSHARLFSGPEEWHPDAWVGRKAVARIQSHGSDQPLFLWASFPGPHYPHDPPQRHLDRVDVLRLPLLRGREGEFDGGDKAQCAAFHRPAGVRNSFGCEGGSKDGGSSNWSEAEWIDIQRHYLANIAMIDDWVGAITAAARVHLKGDLTVVLTADHGDMMGAHRLWGKGGCAYEEVLGVPFLASGPGFEPGTVAGARVSLLDLFPTFVARAGGEPPAGLDGRDILPYLRDGGPRLLFSEHGGILIADDGRHRLSINRQTGTTELYDRETDPGEYDNLAHRLEAREIRRRLERAALEHLFDGALPSKGRP